MSNFYNPHEYRSARKAHQCTYCAEAIGVGEVYISQTGVHDGEWFTSKMHTECFYEIVDTGDGEYTPYSNARPQVVGSTPT